MILGLFKHTDEGSKALKRVLEMGVAFEAIAVVGDLGIAAGEAGSMHHVTLDWLHVPAGQRGMFMEGIREGGVVLAVSEREDEVRKVLEACGAALVETTGSAEVNPSHNPSA